MGFFTVAFAWNTIVLAPLREAESIPIRESRSLRYPVDLKKDNSSAWNVILVSGTSKYNVPVLNWVFVGEGTYRFWQPWGGMVVCCGGYPVIWRKSKWIQCLVSIPQLTYTRAPMHLFATTPMSLSVITFRCPYQADVLVTVNFTKLGIASNSIANGSTNSVQVMVGSIPDIVHRTEIPALLLPGVNVVGFAKQYILQQFKNHPLSTLGLFAVSFSTILPSFPWTWLSVWVNSLTRPSYSQK